MAFFSTSVWSEVILKGFCPLLMDLCSDQEIYTSPGHVIFCLILNRYILGHVCRCPNSQGLMGSREGTFGFFPAYSFRRSSGFPAILLVALSNTKIPAPLLFSTKLSVIFNNTIKYGNPHNLLQMKSLTTIKTMELFILMTSLHPHGN